ncbi:hypothetical protein FF38_04961 [Lucilia cuprina]|uniref:DUF243 domain-containing protein n=1 Tax=Lucilia cuprina TaxID=7375 RepID=A0A0L0CJL1_LUCCU|nr:hypothetical protein FF38_04961 [Lucilia cuprina]
MRGLIILCFAALAVAAPQGYNYPSQPSNQYLAPGAGFDGLGAQGYQQQALVSKRFFIHSAPEDEEVEIQQKDIVIGQPRKNFNVVFIKSPAAAAQKTKIRVIPAVNEDKTVIYVLAKKAGENEIITHVEEPHTTTAKPEVFFIKYKTNEEAEHAQQTIQAEYDRLGGSTVISNEGIAPVSSVIGSLDGHGANVGAGENVGAGSAGHGVTGHGAAGHGAASHSAAGHGVANTAYLPPLKPKLRNAWIHCKDLFFQNSITDIFIKFKYIFPLLKVLCLCAVSMAAPQGYNYNQGGVSVPQSGPGGFGGSFGGVATTATGGGAFFQGGQSLQQSSFGGHQQVQQQHQQAIVSKRFFIHSAPEDVEEDYKEKHITVGVPKKNYNVVFIKSPSKSNKKTAIKISPAPNEEKTVIYVLSKKTDASDIQAEVIEHPTTTAKPEVFFIKYKTNEEANHAQEQIQAQYDALGGTSQVTDEGVAPVTSVIGSLGGDAGASAGAGSGAHVGGSANFGGVQTGSGSFGGVQSGAISGATNSNAYLPPNFY